MIEALGPPDFLGEEYAWEYDIDAEEPYTFSISWSKKGVSCIARTPPAWKSSIRRDRMLVD